MSKYQPLGEHLKKNNKSEVMLTFFQIEKIINDSLPKSAFNLVEWWANDSKIHVQSRKGWLVFGYRMKSIDLKKKIVIFEKIQ